MGLIDRIRDVGLVRHLARSTIDCYQNWIRDFLRFCRRDGQWRHPAEIGAGDVESYLTHLARDRRVSASTQNQAMCAIVFLYKQVLVDELGPEHMGPFEAQRASRPVCVPTVLSRGEVPSTISGRCRATGFVSRRVRKCPLPKKSEKCKTNPTFRKSPKSSGFARMRFRTGSVSDGGICRYEVLDNYRNRKPEAWLRRSRYRVAQLSDRTPRPIWKCLDGPPGCCARAAI